MRADSRQLTADSRLLVGFLGALALLGCAAEKTPARQPFATVATVNGVVLTQADLDAALSASGNGHGPNGAEVSAERRQKALEVLIRDELVRQRALELSLAPNAQHEEELARITARLLAAQRKAMADAFFRHEVEGQIEITEAQVRNLFEENAARLRTELKLNQLLFRDETKAEEVVAALGRGESFEAIAERQFPELPPGVGKPWELDFLSWRQMPSQWRTVIFGLADGQTTGIVRGPNQRFWVLQVAARRENPSLSFDDVKADLVAELKAALIDRRAAQLEAELRAKARISVEPLAPTLAHLPGAAE